MNKLSWFLYLADVFDSLKLVSIIILAIFTFAIIIWSIVFVATMDEQDPAPKPKYKFLLPVVFLSCIVFCIIPSQNTMYSKIGSYPNGSKYRFW